MIPWLPKRVMAVLTRTHLHPPLTKTYVFNRFGEHETVFAWANGRLAPKISVDEAIERGLLVPAGDALIPGDSQTWLLSDEVEDFFGGRLTRQERRA
jgi:hypothetical protein